MFAVCDQVLFIVFVCVRVCVNVMMCAYVSVSRNLKYVNVIMYYSTVWA